MKCEDIIDLLDAYVDGELGEQEKAAVEAHLAGCPTCSAELRELQSVVDAVRGLPPLKAPPAVATGILQAVRRQPQPKPFTRWVSTGVSVAAAAAIILLSLHTAIITQENAAKEEYSVSFAPSKSARHDGNGPPPAVPKANESLAMAKPGAPSPTVKNDDAEVARHAASPAGAVPRYSAKGGAYEGNVDAKSRGGWTQDTTAADLAMQTQYPVDVADEKALEKKVNSVGGTFLRGQQAYDYANQQIARSQNANQKLENAALPNAVALVPAGKAAEIEEFASKLPRTAYYNQQNDKRRQVVAAETQNEIQKDAQRAYQDQARARISSPAGAAKESEAAAVAISKAGQPKQATPPAVASKTGPSMQTTPPAVASKQAEAPQATQPADTAQEPTQPQQQAPARDTQDAVFFQIRELEKNSEHHAE